MGKTAKLPKIINRCRIADWATDEYFDPTRLRRELANCLFHLHFRNIGALCGVRTVVLYGEEKNEAGSIETGAPECDHRILSSHNTQAVPFRSDQSLASVRPPEERLILF